MTQFNILKRWAVAIITLFSCQLAMAAEQIALVQYDADRHFGDTALNRDNLTELALTAIGDGATVVVFPEGSTHGYATSEELWCRPGMTQFWGRRCRDVAAVAEPVVGGPSAEYWQWLATEQQAMIVFSIIESHGDEFYNTAVVIGPDGIAASYRKRSLYWVDQAYATPGDEAVVVDFGGTKMGVIICMDANEARYYREYQRLGVDNILILMDWDQDPNGTGAAREFFRSKARLFQMNIFASDQSQWDGTGLYPASGIQRVRNGLRPVAVGIDGVSHHKLPAVTGQ